MSKLKPSPVYLTLSEAAAEARVSLSTIRRAIATKSLHCARPVSAYRIFVEYGDLMRWIDPGRIDIRRKRGRPRKGGYFPPNAAGIDNKTI